MQWRQNVFFFDLSSYILVPVVILIWGKNTFILHQRYSKVRKGTFYNRLTSIAVTALETGIRVLKHIFKNEYSAFRNCQPNELVTECIDFLKIVFVLQYNELLQETV